jgi:hypothetical protein
MRDDGKLAIWDNIFKCPALIYVKSGTKDALNSDKIYRLSLNDLQINKEVLK